MLIAGLLVLARGRPESKGAAGGATVATAPTIAKPKPEATATVKLPKIDDGF